MILTKYAHLGDRICIHFVVLLRPTLCVKFEWYVTNGSRKK